jgi:CDP-6-deoxy-D-xylo-4-hexulose-3-dehydrase
MIRLHEPTFGEEEIEAAVAVLRSTRVTQGEQVRRFEDEFAAMFRFRNAVACNSGSSANLLAISALVALERLRPGDEVIVSALSWPTTVWPLIQHGLVPVFIDCDIATLNIDDHALTAAMSERTRAVMPVHVYGNPCDMARLKSICRAHSWLLIEDCCEALGARYFGQPVGSFGIAGTFSFYFSHHITTLEGGMIVTEDDALADMMRIQRSHGWCRDVRDEKWIAESPEIDPRFLFVETGYNLRLNEVQAAIGRVQLPKLAAFIQQRRANMDAYRAALGSQWRLGLQREQPGGTSSPFGMPITAAPGNLAERLRASGIETRSIIAGNLAEHPALRKHTHRVVNGLPNARQVRRAGLALPNHQAMGRAEVRIVAKAVKMALDQFEDVA